MERIPVDLARYGEQMHANTAALLRQSLTGDPASFAVTLQQMFDGHDVIAGSPEGQAFRAFTHLIGMPSQRAQLEADIGEILARLRELPALAEDTWRLDRHDVAAGTGSRAGPQGCVPAGQRTLSAAGTPPITAVCGPGSPRRRRRRPAHSR